MPNKDDSIEAAIGAVEDIENVAEDILDDTKAQHKLMIWITTMNKKIYKILKNN